MDLSLRLLDTPMDQTDVVFQHLPGLHLQFAMIISFLGLSNEEWPRRITIQTVCKPKGGCLSEGLKVSKVQDDPCVKRDRFPSCEQFLDVFVAYFFRIPTPTCLEMWWEGATPIWGLENTCNVIILVKDKRFLALRLPICKRKILCWICKERPGMPCQVRNLFLHTRTILKQGVQMCNAVVLAPIDCMFAIPGITLIVITQTNANVQILVASLQQLDAFCLRKVIFFKAKPQGYKLVTIFIPSRVCWVHCKACQ
mmetsp:Transcript_44268/g.82852  ORF Transcript_44268/g.82852 Transcript_44268/m.82852 type:complete len:254 (-) Transcript_44268:284-1045(-)